MSFETTNKLEQVIDYQQFKKQILDDYRLANVSRNMSVTGRKEVLSGRGSFGIFGDGKELPQIAWAKFFKNGDFRSGYYRDQTFMMALDLLTPEQFFASLYGHADINFEPSSGGRQMNNHFATHSLDENGEWKNLLQQKNSSSDISSTGAQMIRLIGLAQASKIYKNLEKLPENASKFSDNGNEIAWGTIGNASTSEGQFWETINAAGVLQVPMVVSVWDDKYGISVPSKFHTTKESISEILAGFQRTNDKPGFEILKVKAWDYPGLIETYQKAEKIARGEHVPVIIHVQDCTQPLGHSTSGSHERYKSKKRLQWEQDFDGIKKMREWILTNQLADAETLNNIEAESKQIVKDARKKAWANYIAPMKAEKKELIDILDKIITKSNHKNFIIPLRNNLAQNKEPKRADILFTARKTIRYIRNENIDDKIVLQEWIKNYFSKIQPKYSKYLYGESNKKAVNIKEIKPVYSDNAPMVDGRIVLRDNFEKLFEKYPGLLIFGEDSGKIGDVNQGLEGLQQKFGKIRVADTGIREATIIGQGIGLAMRGLRPIAEIQYLDYLLYGLQAMSDDLATLHYRTHGKQKAPLIVRTRGHRLEGIWHSGSPMGGFIHLLRGINVLVPRNLTQAAGFYNTMLESDEPALIVESLNGYRLKEKLPENLGEFRVPVGKVEIMKTGKDITLVSYGSTLRLVQQAAKELLETGIDAEVIDIQSLLPFDIEHEIAKSLEKTNRLLIIDEDVPGGASAYILDKILNEQDAWKYLDSKPETLTAKEHRPAYGHDGDYFSKPSVDDIFEKTYAIMHESNPKKYPNLYE
jgi:pyruvate/2-oxoglutarate/acetoin dehydrogenase E1 component/TPP-dependent pyruvate/acetoin dehydrogenase alpha subunit